MKKGRSVTFPCNIDVQGIIDENKRFREQLSAIQQRDRYLNDVIFKNMVDMLYNHLMTGYASVHDLREAVTLACNKFWHDMERYSYPRMILPIKQEDGE